MDTENQRIYDRMTLHRLMRAHPSRSPAQLAEAVGRSERWGRKWVKRLKTVEVPSFRMYLSQSRAPKTRPRQTNERVKDVICTLRETLSDTYHRPVGATLIRHYLGKDIALQESHPFVPTSSRTITKILRERGYIQDAPKREHMPLRLCAPMEEWEMDFCEIRLQDGYFEFFLVVDRGTSRVVYLEGCAGYRADSALLAIFRLFQHHGLPKRLRFDRDSRFVWSWTADGFPAPLIRFLHVLGVEPVECPPVVQIKNPMWSGACEPLNTNGFTVLRSRRWRTVMKPLKRFRSTTMLSVSTWAVPATGVPPMKPFHSCLPSRLFPRWSCPMPGSTRNMGACFAAPFAPTA